MQGPFGLKIWSDTEPAKGTTVAFTIGAWEDRAPITIWMDGRPHPSEYAEHTRGGFTTGRWDGDTLVAYTTHMKAGFLRKNGPPMSDQGTPGLLSWTGTMFEYLMPALWTHLYPNTLLERAAALEQAALRGEAKTGLVVEFLAHEVVAHHLLTADRDFYPLFAPAP